MADGGEDAVLEFLARFVAMSEPERDAALDELPPVDREALIALWQARTETADADLLAVLSSGREGLDKLSGVVDPDDLLTAITLAASEQPQLVVEALFAAVVLHPATAAGHPPIAALREQWQSRLGGATVPEP